MTVLAVSEGSYCPATWDSLACWPQTKAGETAVISCPNYLNQFDSAGIYMHVNYIQTCSSRHLFFWLSDCSNLSLHWKGKVFEFDTINWWSLMVKDIIFILSSSKFNEFNKYLSSEKSNNILLKHWLNSTANTWNFVN